MADWVTDKVPMLSDKNVISKKYTARSASMSIPVNSSYGSDDAFISHTGPLRGDRSSHFVQKPDGVGPHLGKQQSKAFVVMPEEMSGNGWIESDHGGKNEHLLMSGPLGLCNNPDCTSCPAAYKTKQSTYKSTLHLDSKVHSSSILLLKLFELHRIWCSHHSVL